MKIGYIGIGKMGRPMVLHLKKRGYEVVAHNRSPEPLYEIAKEQIAVAFSLEELCSQLETSKSLVGKNKSKVIWLMITSDAVDQVLTLLKPNLSKDDTIIDGGNSYYKDSMRRARELELIGVNFMDVGVCGGIEGESTGTSIMVGGRPEIYAIFEKLFSDLAVENGCAYLGKSGAGHFAKTVHDIIEFGMVRSLAEGFDILKHSEFGFDFQEVLRVYSNGSTIESQLVYRLAEAFDKFGQNLENVDEADKPLGKGTKKSRLKFQKDTSYQDKIISALNSA